MNCFSLCVCSRVFICSLICKHNEQWLFSTALLQLILNYLLNYLFLKGMLIKLPFLLKTRREISGGGREW